MKKIEVNVNPKYNVLLGENLLKDCGELVFQVHKRCTVAIVTDDNVAALYLQKVKNSLQQSGFGVIDFVFLNGEESKNQDILFQMLTFFGENNLNRDDLIIALGGGVVGDIAGFAAGIYKRGIEYIQIPTTLLAQIDSSVGGKTAINTSFGKNMVGVFKQPKLVICDTDTLRTLKPEVLSDGLAEAVKYAAIGSEELLTLIEESATKNLEEIIERCIQMKAQFVEQDERDNGQRQLLNFGHTFGHAVEKCSNFEISHGSGVAIGMVLVCEYLHKKGKLPRREVNRLTKVLQQYNLPVTTTISREKLHKAALGDKKRKGANITFVFIEKIGTGYLEQVPVRGLEKMLL